MDECYAKGQKPLHTHIIWLTSNAQKRHVYSDFQEPMEGESRMTSNAMEFLLGVKKIF